MSVNNSLACDPILKFGSEEIKREYLVPMASGKTLGCFGLTEPGAGSDAGSQKTTAVRDGDFYVVNGTKNFITNAPQADTCVLFTMTDKAKAHKGITAFVVDMKWKGVTLGKHEKKMGIKASATSSIADVGLVLMVGKNDLDLHALLRRAEVFDRHPRGHHGPHAGEVRINAGHVVHDSDLDDAVGYLGVGRAGKCGDRGRDERALEFHSWFLL